MGVRLSDMQWFLLQWLSREDFSLYGECKGAALDTLVYKELAEISGHSDYARVTLTEKGLAALKKEGMVS